MKAKEMDIAGIPLQCLLIGEVYEEEAINFANSESITINSKIFANNSIANLYAKMIRKKFSIATIRYKQSGLLYSELMSAHKYLSLWLIFPELTKHLKAEYHSFTLQHIFNAGILESSSSIQAPRFIHRTFAEYFVALFIEEIFFVDKPLCTSLDIFLSSLSSRKGYRRIGGQSKITCYEFTFPVILHFLNSLMSYDGWSPSANQNETLKVLNSTEDICHLVQACFNNDLEYIFHFFDYIHLFDNAAVQIFDEETLEVLIRKASLGTIKKVMGKYCKESSESDMTFLHVAAERGDFAIFEYVLSEKNLHDDVFHMKGTSVMLIHSCVSHSSHDSEHVVTEKIQILKRLIRVNPRLILSENLKSQIPLLCDFIHLRLLQELINETEYWCVEEAVKGTFLHKASSYLSTQQFHELMLYLTELCSGDLKMKNNLQTLVVHGSKTKGANNEPETPLHSLLNQHGEPEKDTLKLFRDLGANFNSASIFKPAMKSHKSGECIAEIIRLAGGPEEIRKSGQYLLHMAAEAGSYKAVAFLIQSGWDVNEPDKEGFSPLDLVRNDDTTSDWFRLVALFLVSSAKPLKRKEKLTQIMFACVEQGQVQVLDKVIKQGVNLNERIVLTDFNRKRRHLPEHNIFDSVFAHDKKTKEIIKLLMENKSRWNKSTLETSVRAMLSYKYGFPISLEVFEQLDFYGAIESDEDANMYLIHLIYGKHAYIDSIFLSIYDILKRRGADIQGRLENGESLLSRYIDLFGANYDDFLDGLDFFVEKGVDLFENGGKLYIEKIYSHFNWDDGGSKMYHHIFENYVNDDMRKLTILDESTPFC